MFLWGHFVCTQFRTILNFLNSPCTLFLSSYIQPAPAVLDLGEEPDQEDLAQQPPRRRPALQPRRRRLSPSPERRRRPSPPPVRPVAAPAPAPVRPPIRPILRLANGRPINEADAADITVWLLAVGIPGLLLLAALAAAAYLWRVLRRRQRRARRWVTFKAVLLGS